MENRWNNQLAKEFENDPRRLRVYTSRLLGQEAQLVLHGGGNTSVKINADDFFGESVETLFVKGSGWDLATIEEAGFAPLRMDVLKKLAQLETLSDSDMVEQQRLAMLNSRAPNASVEAILHAIIPFRYVDHTHANAILAITNTENGLERIQELFGNRVIVIPYVMPGFALAKLVYEKTKDTAWEDYEGMVLMNHGIFTFSDNAKESYERMIQLVTEAEDYLNRANASKPATSQGACEPLELARLRKKVSDLRGIPVVVKLDSSPEATGFANLENASEIGTRGPLTPDHSIFAKRVPVYLSENISDSIDKYASSYQSYFDQNVSSELTCLDPAPRWGIWPGCGIISFGLNPKNAAVISDIASHTTRVIQISEFLGGWVPLKEGDVFEVEYWELEQAKLKSGKSAPPLQGIIAHISLSESSMANQCKERLTKAGAAVITIEGGTKPNKARSIVEKTVLAHGGLDILITDIGVDSSSGAPEDILSGALPYLKLGINSKIIAIGDVSSSDLHQSHQKIMTYLADSAEKQIGVVVLNPDNGETVISANNSATVTGDPKIVEKITAA
jgi:rhamnose utilization protein RhaD (predicted bifunctional aldolase and dehydrogenase)